MEVDRLRVVYEAQDQQFTQAMKRMQTQGQQTSRVLVEQADRAEASMRRLGSGSIQNVAFQIGDFATQVGAGTAASMALGQQLPQLLGGFGVLGAVLGAAVAIGVPLAAAFIDMGDGAEELAEATQAAEKAMLAFRIAMDDADVSAAELQARFGDMSGAARQLLNILSETAEAKAIIAQEAAVAALQGRFSELNSMVQTYNNLLSSPDALYQADAITWLDQVNEKYGLTIPQAERLLEIVDGIESASGNERVAMLTEIASILRTAAENGGMVDEEMLNLTDSAARAAIAVAEIDNANFSNAVSQVDTLAGRLGNLIAQANSAAAALNAAGVFIGSDGSMQTGARGRDASTDWRFEDPNKDYDTLAERRAREAAAKAAAAARAERAAAGSGNGRKSGGSKGRSEKAESPFFGDIEKDLLNLERQISLVGKSNEEVATAKARWELLDEAKKRGIPVNEELSAQIDAQAANVGRLTAELERGEKTQQQFDQAIDGISDAMAGALFAGESLREGLAQVFKQIASDILSSGIKNAIADQFGGSGGLGILNSIGSFFGAGPKVAGNDALSNSLRGISGFRARGGPVSAGQSYIVGEEGLEVFRPSTSGMIIPNSQIGTGGGNPVTFAPTTSITVQGDASQDTLNAMRRELDARDARLARQIPSIMDNHQKRKG